ncbi:hypothetical protein PORY_002405 [Pneumocystis oryctolagi]|uniref:Uncharacterized protein n=1 Tax=Pneumocystis oryctolagi TaxID=42067 RepID=A0ACB7C957_9ASCO|nr:hypothetical protein PORY_002405 [Pneumocystis oryctolagi]
MFRHANLAENVTQILWKRHYCDYKPTLQERYDCYSRWNQWGRWMVLSMVLMGILIFTCICCTNWSRVSQGSRPIRYTGWITPGFMYQHQQPYGYPMQTMSSYVPPGTTANQHWPPEEQTAPPYQPPASYSHQQPPPEHKEK